MVSLTLLSRPSPTPSQAGRLSRVWVQANCQGIALRDSIPPVGFLLAGLQGQGLEVERVKEDDDDVGRARGADNGHGWRTRSVE